MAYFIRVRSNIERIRCLTFSQFSRKTHDEKKGLLLGVYVDESGKNIQYTEATERFNQDSNGKLAKDLSAAGPITDKGKARTFYNLSAEFPAVTIVSLGKKGLAFNEEEQLNEGKEAVRVAAGVGVQELQNIGATDIFIEDLGDPTAAAEGAGLGIWKYQGFKNEAKKKKLPKLNLYSGNKDEWTRGLILSEAQNFARRLMDTPANYMTPTLFSKEACEALSPLGVQVQVRDQAWAKRMKMESFLSVAKGSVEPPVFVEIHYSGGDKKDKPVVFVGKGVTFDSGGISLKSANMMDEMRADMGGAACVLSAIYGAAKLKLPLNVIGLIPLCENMPSGNANKPGDVVTAMNGKTILVDDTDNEGRLILADALCYAEKFEGKVTLDIATLTLEIIHALGTACTGAYCSSTSTWKLLEAAGAETGDRFWRMPLWTFYTSHVTDFRSADLSNVSKVKMAGSCTAAAFLKEFAPKGNWIHLDMAGMLFPRPDDAMPYLQKGMTGRPTRTLIHFLSQQISKNSK